MKMKRWMAVLLLTLLIGSLVGCGGSGDGQGTADSSTAAPTDTGKEETGLNVPDKTYDGVDFTVLSAGQVAYDDFSYGEDAEAILEKAQYRRRTTVETRFDVKIGLVTDENKSGVGNGSGYKRVSQSVDAGDTDYQMALIGGMDVTTLAYSDYLAPLATAKYIDLSREWWDQNANHDLRVMDNLFFTQGDITAAKSEATYVIYYNKELGRQKLTEDPYQLVTNGKWTVDKLTEFCLKVSEDLDGNSVRDMEDMYGLYVWDDAILGMISAAGQKVATINDKGEFELSIYNEDVLNVIDKFGQIAYNTEYAVMYQRYANAGDVVTHWTNDQALFWANSTLNLAGMREMKSDFGILPFPKLREEQTRYYSTMATYNSQFLCLPRLQEDMEYTSVITEALAYYGRELVRPAVYEKTLTGTYFRDNESADMLDIIFDSYIYDIGQLHRIGDMNHKILDMFRTKTDNFASIYETNRTIAEQQIDTVNDSYRKVLASYEIS